MHITVTGCHGPICCSQCGSAQAVKPLNEPKVVVRCLACGHSKSVEDDTHENRFKNMLNSAGTVPRAKRNPTF